MFLKTNNDYKSNFNPAKGSYYIGLNEYDANLIRCLKEIGELKEKDNEAYKHSYINKNDKNNKYISKEIDSYERDFPPNYMPAFQYEKLKISEVILPEGPYLGPDCQNFISKKLYDFWINFKNFVRIEFIPFGNAKILKNGTIECQHGPEECKINKYESCAIHYMHEPLPFIHCLETKIANGIKLEKASKQCYAKLHSLPHIYDQIMHCFNGQKGDKLQKIAAEQTFNIWPDKNEFVPWILINNASLISQQFFMQQLPTLICQSYIGDNKIKQCQVFGSINTNLIKEKNKEEEEEDFNLSSEELF
ncbi:hypothetical protein Mgra_00002799 [Meloidogyne graminicola]|uniref:GILT-like protein n=1 Tax=Meloidogyne graminicola TaxID=189291 RepID=A0A8S9ZXR6_9BILA|nr:hypothetical protein Mgra_00002799 [Meloidogyne graminicola]